jgi:hypothetical protein
MPDFPTRQLPCNQVLSAAQIGPDAAQALLIVDRTHPFFYDHPLDHVPGLLLIEAAMQLAGAWRAANPGPEPLRRVSVRFLKYCLHEAPVALRLDATPGPEGRALDVLFTQSGQDRARITLHLGTAPGDAAPDPRLAAVLNDRADAPPAPVEAARIGKHDPANRMISTPQPVTGDGAVSDDGAVIAHLLPADPRNALADPAEVAQWHPLYLLEGWMQVLRFLNTAPARQPRRFRDILAGIDLALVAPAPRNAAIALLAETEPRPQDDGRRCARPGVIGTRTTTLARVTMLSARPTQRPQPQAPRRAEQETADV